jgi:hypothetical protein
VVAEGQGWGHVYFLERASFVVVKDRHCWGGVVSGKRQDVVGIVVQGLSELVEQNGHVHVAAGAAKLVGILFDVFY